MTALKTIAIDINYNYMEVAEVLPLSKKILHAVQIGKEYHNVHNIKIKRNIDKMLY